MKNNYQTVIGVVGIMVLGFLITTAEKPPAIESMPRPTTGQAALIDGGNILPLEVEEKMLATLVEKGVIDPAKLPAVTELNLLWALGLANQNAILTTGPITDARYGGPMKMASVGGWNLTRGAVMDHYAQHALIALTPAQQTLVAKMAKGIYRPCCDNPTHFPDCNHGMAMLGLLEYLAASGATEEAMWEVALAANRRWFPGQYQTIDQYLKIKEIDPATLTPQVLLGASYASGSGFARIAVQVPRTGGGGSSCGV